MASLYANYPTRNVDEYDEQYDLDHLKEKTAIGYMFEFSVERFSQLRIVCNFEQVTNEYDNAYNIVGDKEHPEITH